MLLPKFGVYEEDKDFMYEQCFETAFGFKGNLTDDGMLVISEQHSHHKSECGALEYDLQKVLNRNELLSVFKMKTKIAFECNQLSGKSELIKLVDWGNYVGYIRKLDEEVYCLIGKRKSKLLDMMEAINDRTMLEDYNKGNTNV